jgi:hypothetical protein
LQSVVFCLQIELQGGSRAGKGEKNQLQGLTAAASQLRGHLPCKVWSFAFESSREEAVEISVQKKNQVSKKWNFFSAKPGCLPGIPQCLQIFTYRFGSPSWYHRNKGWLTELSLEFRYRTLANEGLSSLARGRVPWMLGKLRLIALKWPG